MTTAATAKDKIESLTRSWYGYDLFLGAAAVVMNGFGVFAMFFAALGTAFSLFVTFVIGRMLLGKSSVTRLVLIILGSISTIVGVLGTARALWMFFGDWSLSLLLYAGLAAVGVQMNIRSLRVLGDKSVKAYFS